MSLQLLVIMVPVFFGLMGFAVDLGRLYLIRSELQAAANAAAIAAAQRLVGTEASTANAADAANLTIENSTGFGNRYDFGSRPIGETTGELASEAPQTAFYEAVASAIDETAEGASEASGATARHVRVSLNAEAPLVFWGLLSLGQERKTRISVSAVAGMSAPLCMACGIEPFAIQRLDSEESADPVDFGFVADGATIYNFVYPCTGTPQPSGTQYLIVQPVDENGEVVDYAETATIFTDVEQQLYRIGAAGLLPSTNTNLSCITVGGLVRARVGRVPCSQNRVDAGVRATLCGAATRFELTIPAGCENINEVDTMAAAYQPDTDPNDITDYAGEYTGNGRRIITVPIVDTLLPDGDMTVLGFRQFLLLPATAADGSTTNINPADSRGRFRALYIGSAMPVKQGRFDGCEFQSGGPGKVVLHR